MLDKTQHKDGPQRMLEWVILSIFALGLVGTAYDQLKAWKES